MRASTNKFPATDAWSLPGRIVPEHADVLANNLRVSRAVSGEASLVGFFCGARRSMGFKRQWERVGNEFLIGRPFSSIHAKVWIVRIVLIANLYRTWDASWILTWFRATSAAFFIFRTALCSLDDISHGG